MDKPYQIVIENGECCGDTFQIEPGSNLVGRWDPARISFPEIDLESCDPDAKVSRKHAMITESAGELFVEDLGSLNGTYLNQELLSAGERRSLVIGDQIAIGPILFRVQQAVGVDVASGSAEELTL